MSPITATLSSTDSIVGSVSQGTQSQVTRVVVPSTNSLSQLTDVDITTLNDGSVLQYNTDREVVYNKENLLNPWFVVE